MKERRRSCARPIRAFTSWKTSTLPCLRTWLLRSCRCIFPVHHDEREERRDLWDADMFKDLMKDAYRTLSEHYPDESFKASTIRPTTC